MILMMENKKPKKVYLAGSFDFMHHGHINLIQKAKQFGDLTIAVTTDKTVMSYKRLPLLSYEERKKVLENIQGVKEVVPHEPLDYVPNLLKYKPDYVIHGDDLRKSKPKVYARIIETLAAWGGEFIEVPYTKGVSSTKIRKLLHETGKNNSSQRRKRLKRFMSATNLTRFCAAKSQRTAVAIEESFIPKENIKKEFDGIWLKSNSKNNISFNESDTNKTADLNLIHSVIKSTTKPIVVELDSSKIEHISLQSQILSTMGVSGICLNDGDHERLRQTIALSKHATRDDSFSNFVGIQLNDDSNHQTILQKINDYIMSGADGVVINSKVSDKEKIRNFATEFQKQEFTVPMLLNCNESQNFSETEIKELGAKVIVHPASSKENILQQLQATFN